MDRPVLAVGALCALLVAGGARPVGSEQVADARPAGRTGVVRLEGRALADQEGPFNPLGVTLFWALWGEQHDPDRLEANLQFLAERGVDYVRILGMVGAESWRDRVIDPRAPDYWDIVDRLLDRLGGHGLRVQVTIFADAQVMMPGVEDRRRFVDAWANRANERPERYLLFEVANEAWLNGFSDTAELRELGDRLAARTGVLTALSAVADQFCAAYAASAVDLATVHYERSPRRGDPWEVVASPWSWPDDFDRGCPGALPPAVNNEPVGPQSSVRGDDDPLRLTMAYTMSFLAGNVAYVLHTGAGVRGGGEYDLARGRSRNVWEVPHIDETLAGIRRVRAALEPGLANCARAGSTDAAFPFEGLAALVADGRVLGGYAARCEERTTVAILGARADLSVRARVPMRVTQVGPAAGPAAPEVRLDPGQPLTLSGQPAYLLHLEP